MKRIDMTVRYNRRIYLFEFKVVEMVPKGKVLSAPRTLPKMKFVASITCGGFVCITIANTNTRSSFTRMQE